MIGPGGERLTLKQFIARANLENQISIVDGKKANLRVDAEYFQPEFLRLEKILQEIPTKTLGELSTSIVNFGAYALCNLFDYQESGVPYLFVGNIKENFFDLNNLRYISESVHDKLLVKSQVKPNQVLITIAGTIGNAAVVSGLSEKVNSNQAIANISLKDGFSPFYVSTFLNSRFGKGQTKRLIVSNVQPNLLLIQVKSIQVPLLSWEQQLEIEITTKRGLAQLELSIKLYAEAEGLLLEALGLDEMDLSPQLSYTAMLDEVETVSRFDADYFQTKYQHALSILRQSGLQLQDVANLAKRRFVPSSGKPFEYIEISNITNDGGAESNTVMGEDAPSRAQFIVLPGDVITSTVRPIRRLSALIEPEQADFVCSSGFAVLEPFQIEPELLLVYLRLPIVAEILDLHTTATMYPAISASDLMQIPVSVPDKPIANAIVSKVRQAREARLVAKQLLGTSKERVERMILGE